MLRVVLILLLIVLMLDLHAQDTSDRIQLISGKKTKTIKKNRVLTIFYGEGNCSGDFQYTSKKSLFLKPYYTEDKNKTPKFFSDNTDSLIQINFQEIISIDYERSKLGSTAAVAFWCSIATALVISPLVALEKGGGFNSKQFYTISGISLGAAVLSAGVIVAFSYKTFAFKSINGKKRIWTFKP